MMRTIETAKLSAALLLLSIACMRDPHERVVVKNINLPGALLCVQET